MLLIGENPANQSLFNSIILCRKPPLLTAAESESSSLTCVRIPTIHLVFSIFLFYNT